MKSPSQIKQREKMWGRNSGYGISLRTLEKHRTYGTGPTYRKIGGRVLYTVEDLQAWADIGTRKSTSDEGAGTVFPARALTPAERSKL